MKSLFRSLNFAGWIIAINLGHAQSFAESPNFANELKNIICSKEIKTSLGPKLMRQTWVPELVSVPSKPLMTGISFRDTQKRVYYRVYAQKKQVNLVVGDYKTKIETLKTWDGQNKCHLETSTQPIPSSVLTIKTGFTDKIFFKL